MDRVLITYGTRPFAQRIGKLIKSTFEVLYASNEDFPAVLLKAGYRTIPSGESPTYAHELLKLALDEDCQFILPLGKIELTALHQARVLLKEYGIKVLIPDNFEDVLIMEQPDSGLQLQIFCDGENIISGMKIEDNQFSGVGILSDDNGSVILCLS